MIPTAFKNRTQKPKIFISVYKHGLEVTIESEVPETLQRYNTKKQPDCSVFVTSTLIYNQDIHSIRCAIQMNIGILLMPWYTTAMGILKIYSTY